MFAFALEELMGCWRNHVLLGGAQFKRVLVLRIFNFQRNGDNSDNDKKKQPYSYYSCNWGCKISCKSLNFRNVETCTAVMSWLSCNKRWIFEWPFFKKKIDLRSKIEKGKNKQVCTKTSVASLRAYHADLAWLILNLCQEMFLKYLSAQVVNWHVPRSVTLRQVELEFPKCF